MHFAQNNLTVAPLGGDDDDEASPVSVTPDNLFTPTGHSDAPQRKRDAKAEEKLDMKRIFTL